MGVRSTGFSRQFVLREHNYVLCLKVKLLVST